MHWHLLKDHEAKKSIINANGHAVDCTVTIQWQYEDETPRAGHDFDHGSTASNMAYLKRFDRGELVNVGVTVIARGDGLEGLDHLGCCHMSGIDFDKDVLQTVEWHEMVEIAIKELTKNLIDRSKNDRKYHIEGTDFAEPLCQTRLKGGVK